MTATLDNPTDTDLSGLLEQDYRRQLRWYPKQWRAAHGEALIGTLLDEADDTDRFTLQPGEWRSFAAAGIASRLDRIIMRPVRDAAATVMLSMGVGVSLVSFVVSSWAPWGTGVDDLPVTFGPFHDAGPVLTALWGVAFVAALADRWWMGRLALLASILVAVLVRPIETLIAPPHFFSLSPGTLTLSAATALLAVLGRPRAGLPLLAASAGWAGLACLCHGYQLLAGGSLTDSPAAVLLGDPARTSWAIALVLLVAAVFAIARFWTPAFTLVLAVTPATAAFEVLNITAGAGYPPVSYLLISVPVAAGLVLLVLASRGTLRTPSPISGTSTAPHANPGTRRRRTVTVAIITPLLVLGGIATVFTAAGLDWTRPTAVNWTAYWQITNPNNPWPDWAQHPDAALTYPLPSGGSCTIRLATPDGNLGPSAPPAARTARHILATASINGTLLNDAQVTDAIAQYRTEQNTGPNFWGVPVRYGYGTDNYNPDVEYSAAVDEGIRGAAKAAIQHAGDSASDLTIFSAQHCSGMQH